MASLTRLTPHARAKFLEVLGNTANVTRGAEAIRVSRQALYQAKASDPDFAAEWEQAVELGSEALEDEAVRRAHEGVLKPVYQGGKKVGETREFSDTMLLAMLKARRPERFKERVATDHTGTIKTTHTIDFTGLPADERSILRDFLARRAQRSGGGPS